MMTITLVVLSYFLAFMCGFIVANQTAIHKNCEQIRRNSETIRKDYEAYLASLSKPS